MGSSFIKLNVYAFQSSKISNFVKCFMMYRYIRTAMCCGVLGHFSCVWLLVTLWTVAPQVLLPMVADLLRVQPLSSWTPKNHPHSLLMVKHLPRPSHCDPCLFLECWLLALASRCWGIAFLPGVACLKLLLVNPPALELVLKQGEVSSFLLGIK